jgi:hypothetical protein
MIFGAVTEMRDEVQEAEDSEDDVARFRRARGTDGDAGGLAYGH